MKIFGAR